MKAEELILTLTETLLDIIEAIDKHDESLFESAIKLRCINAVKESQHYKASQTMPSDEDNKYHFAREIIFELRACRAISGKVFLHWIDKLNKEQQYQPKD